MTGVSPGTTTLEIPGYGAIELSDWIDDRHWTTAQLQNGDAQTLNLFSQGKSQTIVGGTRISTLVDTNIPSTGTNGLPLSWEFLVYGFAMSFTRAARPTVPGGNLTLQDFSDPLRVTTFFQLQRRLFCKYIYNGKMYSEGLVSDYPQGQGMSIFTTQANTEIANNGVPSPRDRIAMVLPVNEQQLLGYAMEITPVIALSIDQPPSDDGANLTFVDLRCTKNGLIKRTVV
jgi:hypothetical protein